MAEYNPSKIIKDGNTYNFRDTTKIPLAGSNQISGDLIPSTDGTVNLGSPSYQWNNAYIKSLTINGVACGDILTHNANEFANDANVVHVRGSDSIIDSKTFISLYTQSSGPSLWMKNTSFTMGTAPTTNRYSGLWVQDNDGTDTAYIVHQANKNNSQNLKFSVSNTDGTTVYQNALTFQGKLDGTFNFYSDNPASLGTSTNKWSKVYSDDVVHTTGNETISGVKTFIGNPSIKKASPYLNIVSMGYVKGVAPSSNIFQGVRFYDDETSSSENHIVGGFESQYSTSGYNAFNINCRNYNQNNVQLNYTLGLYVPNDSTRPIQFAPAVNNIINLGSITYQWNNTYTRNILIDNDINIASSLINKTSTSGVISIRGGLNTQDGASIGLYGKDYNGGIAGNIYMTAYGNSDYTNFRIYPNGAITVYNNSTSTTKNVAMQEDTIPRSGGAVISGYAINRINNAAFVELNGGTAWANGAGISLRGKDCSAYGDAGCFHILASDGTNTKSLSGGPDGTLTWGNKNLAMQEDTVPRSGGAVMTGTNIGRAVSDSFFSLYGGAGWRNGASVALAGKDQSSSPGSVTMYADNGTQIKTMELKPDGTWAWDGTACQIISDQRLKQQISNIDDKLLDAWEDVNLVQFKYNDAVDAKKDKARLHTGYVVQQIDTACKSHNVDISAYGLYCHEEYPQETEEVEVEQKDGTKVKERKVIREASEHYSLRYTEVYAVECMYLRRCIARLTARIEQLEGVQNK